MNKAIIKQTRRAQRTRAKLHGNKTRPRLTVFRSNRYMYVQLIDDETQKTLLGVSEKQLAKETTGTKSERAKHLGMLLAKIAKERKITTVVFDRGSYSYHGRVKNVAEGAREGGLLF